VRVLKALESHLLVVVREALLYNLAPYNSDC
jgi:hypothetical protein